MKKKKKSTNADTDLSRCPIPKRRQLIRAIKGHRPYGGADERYAQGPVHIDEEHRHMEVRLFDIAAPITLALRSPKMLGYDSTTRPEGVIENPDGSSLYCTPVRTVIRGNIGNQVGTGPVLDCSDLLWVNFEEII